MAELTRRTLPMPTRHPALALLDGWPGRLGYLAVFIGLDWFSFERPLHNLNITPWSPQPALAVAVLMLRPRLWWLVLAGLLASEAVVRSGRPDGLSSAALTGAYLLVAAVLRRLMPLGPGLLPVLRTAADVLRLSLLAVAGGAVNALGYVGATWAGGLLGADFADALLRYWLADAVGLLISLPLVLACLQQPSRVQLLALPRQPQAWAIALACLAVLWFMYRFSADAAMHWTYLLLVPMVWAAARFGAVGALALTQFMQICLAWAGQHQQVSDGLVFESQALLAVVSLTGLMLGVAVEQRARAEAELRRSLRLAAAGQSSAAMAHELSQPLTALATQAQVCELLAQRLLQPQGAAAQDVEQLSALGQRMAAEARRAGEVVRRLRDFFRGGGTRLAPVDLPALLRQALERAQPHAQALGVRLNLAEPLGPMPPAMADALQLGIVLRNLLANAIEASTRDAARPGQVTLSAQAERGQALLMVRDNGPGLSPQRALAVFDGEPSDKPGGMGMGLSMSRAMIEAHGGNLWAVPGSFGLFCINLPLEDAAQAHEHTRPKPDDPAPPGPAQPF